MDREQGSREPALAAGDAAIHAIVDVFSQPVNRPLGSASVCLGESHDRTPWREVRSQTRDDKIVHYHKRKHVEHLRQFF